MCATGSPTGCRAPEYGDIVIVLVHRRNLDEHQLTFAPVSMWLHPDVRTLMICGLNIRIVIKFPMPLQQAKAHRLCSCQHRYFQIGRVLERTPNPFAVRHLDRQPLGVVHGWAKIIALLDHVMWRKIIHGGEW